MDINSTVIQSPILESIHTKCGELFISNKGEFLFYCSFWFCNEQFKTFHHFATHLFENHYSRLNIIELPQQQNILIANNNCNKNIEELELADDSIICLSDTDEDDDVEQKHDEEIKLKTQELTNSSVIQLVQNQIDEKQSITEEKYQIAEELPITKIEEKINIINDTVVIPAKAIIQPLQNDEQKTENTIQLIPDKQLENPKNEIEIINNLNTTNKQKIKKNNIKKSNKKSNKRNGKLFKNSKTILNSLSAPSTSSTIKTKNKINYTEYSYNIDDDLDCAICGKTLLSECGLKSHMERHINGNFRKKKRMKDENLESNADNIQEEIKINNNEQIKTYKCRHCNDTFKNKPYFIKHENNHINDNKIYKCDVCDQAYFSKSALRIHTNIHTNNRIEFQCDICNKKLLTARYLKIHKMKHEEKYVNLVKCTYCHLKYSETYLPIHELIHTEGLKFKCRSCDKKFLTKGHLGTHEKKHINYIKQK